MISNNLVKLDWVENNSGSNQVIGFKIGQAHSAKAIWNESAQLLPELCNTKSNN